MKNLKNVRKIVKTALEECDCAIFRAPSPISLVAYPVIQSSSKPFSVELMMNPYTAYSKEALKHPMQPLIQYVVTNQTKKMCLNANGVSYVTERVLQNLYPCKAMLSKNKSKKYFTSSYSTITLKENDFYYKKWENDENEPITLLHSGKMEDYRKGQLTFINLIRKLIESGINVNGIMLGDGAKRGEFEQIVTEMNLNDKIEFIGWVTGFESIKKHLRRADIFVFPTIGEGLPRSLIEAMANGLVCISSPVDGVVELLDSSYLSNYNDVDSFYEIVKNLISNKERMKTVSIENTNKAKKYEESLLRTKRLEFYKKLRNCSELLYLE